MYQIKKLYQKRYDEIYNQNPKLADFIYKFWGDRKMIKTFPNLKTQDVNGNIVYMDSFLDIQPYYMRVHDIHLENNKEVEDNIKEKNKKEY